MAIAPPSDIILDVAQAADPQRLQAATSKLARMAAGGGVASDSFDLHLTSAAAGKPSSNGLAATTLLRTTPAIQTQSGSPYRKFEAMVLQSFVENILPKDDNLFGDAASADMCRSMLAEQLAGQLAKGGVLGIAKMIKGAHPPLPAGPAPGPMALSGPGGPVITGGTLAAPVPLASVDPLAAELASETQPSAGRDAS